MGGGTFVNEKCVNVRNIKLKEDFVLFGNAKQMKMLTVSYYLQRMFMYMCKMENKRPFFRALKNNNKQQQN